MSSVSELLVDGELTSWWQLRLGRDSLGSEMTVNPFLTAHIIEMSPKIDKDLNRFSLDSLVDKIKQI